jgi:putative aldouronate transport system substrate-binding protein
MKFLKAVACVFLSVSLIAGCSSGNGGGSATKENAPVNSGAAPTTQAAKNEEKIPITIAVKYWNGAKWPEDHPTIKYLNEKFNIDLKLQIINGGEYGEKFKVMAASGDLPDVYSIDGSDYLNWQSQGAFVDLMPLLPKYPNLSKAYPADNEAVKMLNPSGKIFGLTNISWIVRDTVQIRQDWLDNLGIKLPTADEFTIDKFYEIAKAFAKGDPDKNGVNGDTIGFTGNIPQVRNAFGIANEWTEKDGKFIPRQTQVEEYKAYLAFMKMAYDEGVLDRDFVLRKGNEVEDMMKGSKLGLFNYHNGYHLLQGDIKKNNPNLNPVVTPMAPPIGPKGDRGNNAYVNGTSKLVINSKADAEKIDRILQIFDWWVTDEGTSIMKNGIEGIHYKKNADGKYEVTDKWESDFPRFLNSSLFTRPGTDFIIFAWSNEEDLQRHNAYTELAKKYPWTNDAGGLEFYSKTYTDKAANLNTKFEEAVLQIIVGKQPVEYIEQASKDWLANGGEQIIKEINEAVKK